jgi:hypothetical protein
MASIHGLPFESLMINENSELNDASKVFSVSPAEGKKPMPMLSEYFEELSNPGKYPDGKNGLTAQKRSLHEGILTRGCWIVMESLDNQFEYLTECTIRHGKCTSTR